MSSNITNIYILELEGGYYYVGKSDNPEGRWEDHKNGNGSAWTKKHRPIRILKVISGVSPFEEDKQVKELMAKYGIDRVRGGSYVQINLDRTQEEMLKKEIRGAIDLCSRCGRAGHFVASCNAEKDTEMKAVVEKEVVNTPPKSLLGKRGGACHRCGRTSHWVQDCYASTHVDGYELSDDDDEDDDKDENTKPRYPSHAPLSHPALLSPPPALRPSFQQSHAPLSLPAALCGAVSLSCSALPPEPKMPGACHRCGRTSHWAQNCYANTHVDGYRL